MIREFSAGYVGLDWAFNPAVANETNPIVTLVDEARAPYSTLALSPIMLRYLPQFANRGWLRSLDPLFPSSARGRFAPVALELCSFNDVLYAAPDDLLPYVLFARKDLLRKHGLSVPDTWRELERQLTFWIKRGRSRPLRIREASPSSCVGFMLALLGANGIDFSLGVEHVLRQRKPLIEAFEWVKRLILRGQLQFPKVSGQEKQPNPTARYLADDLVYLLSWPMDMQRCEKKLAGNTAMVPLPRGPSARKVYLPVEGTAWCVLHNTASLDISFELIKLVTGLSAVRRLELYGGCLFPATKSLWKDPDILAKNPLYGKAPALLKAATPCSVDPLSPDWSQFYLHFTKALQQGESGRTFVDTLSAEADRKVNLSIATQLLRNAVSHIDRNLSQIKSVNQVARHVGRHPDYLNRIFKKELSINCKAYIQQQKMRRAKTLLGDVTLSVKEIARLLGFGSASVFSRSFTRHCGCTPIQMRRRTIDDDRVDARKLWSPHSSPFA